MFANKTPEKGSAKEKNKRKRKSKNQFLTLFKRGKDMLGNGYAMSLLLGGLGIIAASIGVALKVQITALPAIAISATGTFVGTFIVARALRRFSKSYFRSESEEVAKAEQARIDAESKLRLEIARSSRLEQDIEAAQDKIQNLEHRLSIFANVTEIQPACELVIGKCGFDITDFHEEEIDREEGEKPHPLSKNYHLAKEFYRGVYERSGVLKLAVDLPRINLRETEREILLYGPFAYNTSIETGSEHHRWKMKGRREREYWKGSSKDDMELVAVKVTKLKDEKRAEQQEEAVQDQIRNLKAVDSMKSFSDNMVVEFVKLLLKPVGKPVRYFPTLPDDAPEGITTLSDFVSDFNRRLKTEDRHLIE